MPDADSWNGPDFEFGVQQQTDKVPDHCSPAKRKSSRSGADVVICGWGQEIVSTSSHCQSDEE